MFSEVPLRNIRNIMYTGEVQVGTPSKKFNVVFDTGSSDFWLFSSRTIHTMNSFTKYYDHNDSVTSVVSTDHWSIQYGAGTASGNMVYDTVFLSGHNVSSFSFAEATKYSSEFERIDLPMDGILGLAFQSNSVNGNPTLIDRLKTDGKISRREFSFSLNKENPEFILGEHTERDITFIDLPTSLGIWLLSAQKISMDSVIIDNCENNCGVLIDTGTSYIIMPSLAFTNLRTLIYTLRPDCKYYQFGYIVCSTNSIEGLPTIKFYIQGIRFTLYPGDYWNNRVLSFTTSPNLDIWILGDTFLRVFYTIFDMDGKRIGFKVGDSSPVNQPNDKPRDLLSIEMIIVYSCIGVIFIIAIVFYCMKRRSAAE